MTYAIYRPIHQSIALRVNGSGPRDGIDCLAHELAGHWLDYASVPPQRWVNRIMSNTTPFYREILCTSLLDAMIGQERTIYYELFQSMVPYPAGFEQNYPGLFSPSELWARAVEQLIADRLHRQGIRRPTCVKPVAWYYDRPGYWSPHDWRKTIRKLVHDGFEARLWMATRVHGQSESRIRKPPQSYRAVFPWVDEYDLQFFGHHLAEQYVPRDIQD